MPWQRPHFMLAHNVWHAMAESTLPCLGERHPILAGVCMHTHVPSWTRTRVGPMLAGVEHTCLLGGVRMGGIHACLVEFTHMLDPHMLAGVHTHGVWTHAHAGGGGGSGGMRGVWGSGPNELEPLEQRSPQSMHQGLRCKVSIPDGPPYQHISQQ